MGNTSEMKRYSHPSKNIPKSLEGFSLHEAVCLPRRCLRCSSLTQIFSNVRQLCLQGSRHSLKCRNSIRGLYNFLKSNPRVLQSRHQRACRGGISRPSDRWALHSPVQLRTSQSQVRAHRQLIPLETTERGSHMQKAARMFQAARELPAASCRLSTIAKVGKFSNVKKLDCTARQKQSPNLE